MKPRYLYAELTPVTRLRKSYMAYMEFEIEVWATSCCFLRGHRIRVDLACYDSNAFDFGGHYYGLKVGRDTIYHDKDHPSHIVLPVIPSR